MHMFRSLVKNRHELSPFISHELFVRFPLACDAMWVSFADWWGGLGLEGIWHGGPSSASWGYVIRTSPPKPAVQEVMHECNAG